MKHRHHDLSRRNIFHLILAAVLLHVLPAAGANLYTNDTDWGGQDLVLEDGDVIAGVHTNITHFVVAEDAAATVQPYGPVFGDPVYSNEVVIGYASTNYYGWVRVHCASSTVSGTLSADAAGYPAMQGAGCGSGRTGAAHGGRSPYANMYGDPSRPDQLGSGGGEDSNYPAGGAGGGAIRIDANGTVVLEGTLSANGQNGTGRSGGGSGGSLWLRADRIEGRGRVLADGGSGSVSYLTAAAGGRIAFETAQNEFTGMIRAGAGTGRTGFPARNGTFNFHADPNLDLVITNDIALPPGTNWVFKSLTVTNGATFEVQSLPGTIEENYTNERASRITILENVTIAEDSALSADGQGYWVQAGPGQGTGRASGAYGGRGGPGSYGNGTSGISGVPYGSPETPNRLGSGGGGDGSGNAGGGALILDVNGTVTVEGTLSAHGARSHYRGGGGSGGSVWIAAAGIRGNGVIAANGGQTGYGGYSGGGGGGRIAFETEQNAFAGTMLAQGQPGSFTPGRHGTFTFASGEDIDLVISGDIALPPRTNWVFRSLTVTDGARLEVQSTPGTAAENHTNEVASRLNILENLVVEESASLSADGLGYLGGEGPGVSGGDSVASSGASHGGAGGQSRGYFVGEVYGAPQTPDRLGSGNGLNGGSSGGGALLLTVGDTVRIDGSLSADGDTRGYRDGGGSGGSIWVTAAVIEGSGHISADGGGAYPRDDRAGGGGGGRIALEVLSDRFTGEEPGTYIEYAGSPSGTIRVDGGIVLEAEDGTPGTFFLFRPRGTLLLVQ